MLVVSSTCDVDAELVLDFAIEHAFVGPLVLLFESLHAENGLVRVSVRPLLEASSLHGEVLESLVPFHGGHWVSPDLQHAEDGLFFAARPFVAWLVGELGRPLPGLERNRFLVPSLAERSGKS